MLKIKNYIVREILNIGNFVTRKIWEEGKKLRVVRIDKLINEGIFKRLSENMLLESYENFKLRIELINKKFQEITLIYNEEEITLIYNEEEISVDKKRLRKKIPYLKKTKESDEKKIDISNILSSPQQLRLIPLYLNRQVKIDKSNVIELFVLSELLLIDKLNFKTKEYMIKNLTLKDLKKLESEIHCILRELEKGKVVSSEKEIPKPKFEEYTALQNFLKNIKLYKNQFFINYEVSLLVEELPKNELLEHSEEQINLINKKIKTITLISEGKEISVNEKILKKEIPYFKKILKKEIPYFKKILSCDVKGSKEKKIDLSNTLSYQQLRLIPLYLDRQVKIDKSNVIELFIFSDLLRINKLNLKTKEYMIKNLTLKEINEYMIKNLTLKDIEYIKEYVIKNLTLKDIKYIKEYVIKNLTLKNIKKYTIEDLTLEDIKYIKEYMIEKLTLEDIKYIRDIEKCMIKNLTLKDIKYIKEYVIKNLTLKDIKKLESEVHCEALQNFLKNIKSYKNQFFINYESVSLLFEKLPKHMLSEYSEQQIDLINKKIETITLISEGMLSDDLKESKENKIDLSNTLSYQQLRLILLYFDCQVQIDRSNVIELFILSDLLLIDTLNLKTKEYMAKNLTLKDIEEYMAKNLTLKDIKEYMIKNLTLKDIKKLKSEVGYEALQNFLKNIDNEIIEYFKNLKNGKSLQEKEFSGLSSIIVYQNQLYQKESCNNKLHKKKEFHIESLDQNNESNIFTDPKQSDSSFLYEQLIDFWNQKKILNGLACNFVCEKEIDISQYYLISDEIIDFLRIVEILGIKIKKLDILNTNFQDNSSLLKYVKELDEIFFLPTWIGSVEIDSNDEPKTVRITATLSFE